MANPRAEAIDRERKRLREYDPWKDLCRRIDKRRLVPIIGSAVLSSLFFDVDDTGSIRLSPQVSERDAEHQFRIDEQLAREWAEDIRYPLADSPLQLCRIAQYNQVNVRFADTAKANYLAFIKLHLLQLALEDEDAADTAQRLLDSWDDLSYSEIAFQLGYPKFENQEQDPLHLLARLPLPVYVTTSHHDFIERALVDVGKHPRVQVCAWTSREHPEREWFGQAPNAQGDLDAKLTEARPLVYHLFGLEKYPASLVVSEDDYMDFLIRVSEDRDVVPPELTSALAESSVLLLGYRLGCWDFRVLFRTIIRKAIKDSKHPLKSNLAIQLDPPVQTWIEEGKEKEDYLQDAREYLEGYLGQNFVVVWNSVIDFIQDLLRTWAASQR
jgi:hypothetical protein